MGAAIDPAGGLDAVTENAAIAMRTFWRQRMHGAFETVEHMLAAIFRNGERFVVVVSAGFTLCHWIKFLPQWIARTAARGR